MYEFISEVPKYIKDQLELIPPGFMFYTLAKEVEDKEGEGGFTLIIKDEQKRLNKLKPVVRFGSIAIGHDINNVMVINMLVKFEDIQDTIYECLINGKDHEWGKLMLQRLSIDDKMYIMFANENNEIVRRIMINNTVKKEFIKFQMKLSEWLDWTDEEFIQAKEIFLNTTRTDKLWDKYMKKKKQ